MKKLLALALLALVAFIAYAVFWPSRFDPQAWTPARTPTTPQTATESSDGLAKAQRLARGVAHGPEDVAIDNQGRIYAGYEDGTIRRFGPDGGNGEVFATTNGRPLGLAFAPAPPASKDDGQTADPDARTDGGAQTLLVADADKGLLAVNAHGDITVLTDIAEGTPFGFTDDVDVAKDGQIYFTDASSKYGKNDYRTDLLEHGGHGRLLKYNPKTSRVTVLLGGLQFANGVAVGPDDAYVLVVETGSYRITRYWLTGENAGQTDIFADNLPGFPDGISYNDDGTFWVALFAPRDATLDFAADKPWLRRIVYHLPEVQQPAPRHVGHILGLNTDGKVVANLKDADSDAFAPITSVEQAGDTLYLGSLTAPSFARIPRPGQKKP